MTPSNPLIFAHIGDLHITKSGEKNYKDFLSILAQIETECGRQLDFVYLPGDIADNGLPAQYQLVATGLKMLSVPVHAIAGDHDMEQGSLNNFNQLPCAEKLPKAVEIKGLKCIFLDVCGNGKGGPDFRLGTEQFDWLQKELETAEIRSVIFMHTYPDDLVEQKEKDLLNQLIAKHNVLLVDMGHTHYNDISNDGHTVFTATRSTGQIEEGPVGYSLVSIDGDTVSWRFKMLEDAFPFVMITNPGDYRLTRDNAKVSDGTVTVNAVIFGYRKIAQVSAIVGEQRVPLSFSEINNSWNGQITISEEPLEITVEATDETGRPGRHTIIYNTNKKLKDHVKNGSDQDTIGAWPENGVFGTQLGPNRNGKPS